MSEIEVKCDLPEMADAEPASVGDANFAWVMANASEFLIERARDPQPFQMTGSWPESIG